MQAAASHYQQLNNISRAALSVVALVVAIGGLALVLQRIKPNMRARNQVERVIMVFLILSSTIAIFTTIGIVLSLLFEAVRFFKVIPVTEFLFGLKWSPQMAIRADQVGASGAFGAVPVFAGTLLISLIAMTVAVPIGLLSAIYLSEYAARRFRAMAKPILEILAGIPTVVYGFFAALTVAPLVRQSGEALGLSVSSESALAAGLKRRYAAERRFKLYGLVSIIIGLLAVAFLFIDITSKGYSAFFQTYIELQIHFDEAVLDPSGERTPEALAGANYKALIKKSLRDEFPEVSSRRERRKLTALVSTGASFMLRQLVMDNPSIIGTTQAVWVLADDDVDTLIKGQMDREVPQDKRRLKDNQLQWIDQLIANNRIEKRFNTALFTNGDSREPELAGIGGAVMGSVFTLMVTLALSFPIGVAAAVYLEEFAPKNRWTDLIEVNINNLAAVPSIVFGLLGLAVFIQFLGVPRSSPLVGDLVLTLMTLPTMIIASRAALKSVPPSIRKAALWDEVKDNLEQPGTGLSGGQQQRLCIARAIAIEPEVVLMDEPCSALDPISTAKIEELMDELRENYTIVIVTHSMQQAARVSQRTAYFHLGDLIEAGETAHIFTNPQHELTQDYITGRFG